MKIEIPAELLGVAKPKGFMRWFWLIKSKNPTMTDREAYEQVEYIHEKYWDSRMYSSFDSFRKCRDNNRI